MRAIVRRYFLSFLALGVALFSLISCTEQTGVSGLAQSRSGNIALRPQLSANAGHFAFAPINRIHLVARRVTDNGIVADTVVDVVDSPTFEIGFNVPPDAGTIYVEISLINVTNGVESVEFSAKTEPIVVKPGQTSSPASDPVLQPGPVSNLSITSISISPRTNNVIEGAGVDYILPYWMARYYGVIAAGNSVQSAAAPAAGLAPGSLASIFGTNLAPTEMQAQGLPLPTILGGVSLAITDAAGHQFSAPLLYVGPGQINLLVPDGIAPGSATFVVNSGTGSQTFTANIQNVAPALFSMNGTGSGVAAATAVMVQGANPALQSPAPVFQCSNSICTPVPINLGVDTPTYLTFYGTGIRNRSSLDNVSVTIKNASVPVQYAGPSPNFAGLDQVNVAMPLSLRGSGESNVVVTVDGQTSNTVMINIQ